MNGEQPLGPSGPFDSSCLLHLNIMYVLWCRRRTPDALWTVMPYSARSYAECATLLAHFDEQWPNHYDFEIHPNDRMSRPRGMAVPYSF